MPRDDYMLDPEERRRREEEAAAGEDQRPGLATALAVGLADPLSVGPREAFKPTSMDRSQADEAFRSGVPLPDPNKPPPEASETPGAPAPPPIAPVPPVIPAPAGGTVDRKESSGSRSSTKQVETKEEAKIREEQAKQDEATVKANKAETAAAVERAKAEEDAAKINAGLAAKKETDTQQTLQAFEAEVAKKSQIATDAENDYKSRLKDFDSTNKKDRFWAKQDTPSKIRANISLVLGIFGGLKDGSNVGAERIIKAIDDDEAKEKTILSEKLGILERARGDVTEAKNSLRQRLEILNLRSAVALERTAAEIEMKAKRLGINEAELKGNAGLLKIGQAALERRQQHEVGLRETVKRESSWSKVSTPGAPGGTGGDKPIDKWNGDEKKSEGFAQRMFQASQDLDRYNYSPSDISALQNRALQEAVMPGAGSAIIDRAIGPILARLSPEGKKRFLAEQEFARANLRRESGAAISIGEMMGEVEGIGERPGDNPETRAQKRQQRLAKVGAVGVSSGRPTFWQQQVGQAAGAQVAPVSRLAPAQIAELKRRLEANPNHPRAAEVRAILMANGAM